MAVLVLECIGICFILLIACVIAIANGVEQAAFLFERDVQDRVVSLGRVTRAQLKRNLRVFKATGHLAMVAFALWAVYGVNGARGFWQPFWQIWVLAMAEGLFDRLFIDWYWVGHTRAWTIPGTEDLKPYIPPRTKAVKWAMVLIGNPIIAAALAGLMLLFRQ